MDRQKRISELDAQLKRTFLPNGKMVRQIELKKFRGIRILNTSYLFTLEEGRFKAFIPWNIEYVNSFQDEPMFLDYNEKNLGIVFDSLFKMEHGTKIGTIIFEPTHTELMNLWMESFIL